MNLEIWKLLFRVTLCNSRIQSNTWLTCLPALSKGHVIMYFAGKEFELQLLGPSLHLDIPPRHHPSRTAALLRVLQPASSLGAVATRSVPLV